MEIANKPVTSREYKLILKPSQVTNRNEGSESFFRFMGPLIEKLEGKIEGDSEEKMRRVWYLDTEDFQFRQNKFILRLREEQEAAKKFKLTLKHRNPDRYLSASKDLSISDPAEFDKDDIDIKFEEDIVRDFGIKFANSTSVRYATPPKLQTMADVLNIFPNLVSLGIAPNTPIAKVRNREVFEVKRESGKIDFGAKPKVKPCLSLWYSSKNRVGQPLIAEFSFDYDLLKKERKRLEEFPDSLERFPLHVVHKSATLFEALHIASEPKTWFILEGNVTTKTAFIYGN